MASDSKPRREMEAPPPSEARQGWRVSVTVFLALVVFIGILECYCIEFHLTVSRTESLGILVLTAILGVSLLWQRREAQFAKRQLATERKSAYLARRFEILHQNANDIILLFDRNGKIIEANNRAVEVYGYSREELCGMKAGDLRAPEFRASFESDIHQIEELKSRIFEITQCRKDGSEFPVEVSMQFLELHGQGYFQSFIRDITERKRQEAEIDRLNRLYSALSQINQSIVQVRSKEELFAQICRVLVEFGRFKMAWIGWVNQDTKEVSIVARQGDDGGYLNNIRVYADDRPEGRGPTGICIRQGRTYVCNDFAADPATIPWRKTAEREQFRSSTAVPVHFRGEICGALMVYATEKNVFGEKEVLLMEEVAADTSVALDHLDDERKRRETEEALRESEERVRATFDNAGVGILEAEKDDRFIAANDRVCEILGYHREELLNMTVNDLTFPEDRNQSAGHNAEIHEGGRERVDYEKRYVKSDGSPLWVHVTISSIRNAAGEWNRSIATVEDVSERKKAEAKLAEQLDELRRWYAVMLDREDRVQELKREVNDLSRSLGKPIRYSSQVKYEELQAEMAERMRVEAQVQAAQTETARLLALAEQSRRALLSAAEDQRAATTALRESEFFFKESQRAARIGSYKTDFTTGFWESSEVLDQIFGIDRGYVRNVQGWLDIIHQDDRMMLDRYLKQEILSCGIEFNKEYRIVRKSDRELRWVHGLGKMDYNANGDVVSMIGTIQDITDRREAEQANRQLMVAIDQAAESIVFTDDKAAILYVNQGFEKVTGYTRQEVLGKNPRVLKSGRQTSDFYKNMWDTLTYGNVWHGRFTNRRKDGSLYEEDATISPIRDGEGNIISYVAVKRDVTRELLLEQQMIEAQKMEGIGHLAGGVAHDFNNILAAAMMQLGMLLDEPDLAPDLREALEGLQSGTERAANLTRQLLLFSRRQAIRMKPVELNALLDEELKMLRRLLGEHIDLIRQSQTGAAWIEGDPGMIEQVIMNLCINARDAMPNGGQLTIGIQLVEFDAAAPLANIEARMGKFACLSVTDVGVGMNEETQRQIFEPFFTTKEVGKGTGLGLASVFGIVKQHGGWIEVESNVGEGTVFRVYIPACDATHPGDSAIVSKQAMHGHEAILFVEDDDSVRKIVVRGLERLGYRVIVAVNGVDALRLWNQNNLDISLLLTDMVMPEGMSGLDLARRLKQENPDLRVVVSSGYSTELNKFNEKAEPGIAYLSKPYELTTLARTLRECLDGVQ